jgi:hypothetical protein
MSYTHTRPIRHRSSNLNADLFRVYLINESGCVCGWVIEDVIHFFLECCLYVEAREQLTNNLQLFVGVNQQWRKCPQKKIVNFNI